MTDIPENNTTTSTINTNNENNAKKNDCKNNNDCNSSSSTTTTNSCNNTNTTTNNNNNNTTNKYSDLNQSEKLSIDEKEEDLLLSSFDNNNNNNNNNQHSKQDLSDSQLSNIHQMLAKTSDPADKDVNYMHSQVKKLQKLLLSEQDKFTKLQKRLQDSENQRLELISDNNRDIFNLNSQCTKLRAELEKSEAIRQSNEYELSVIKNSYNKERAIYSEKEKVLEEINRNLDDKLNVVTNENNEIKSRLKAIDNEYAAELTKFRSLLEEKEKFFEKYQKEQDLFENERLTYNALVKEQEKINFQLKEELLGHKDVIRKLNQQLENNREREERVRKENEEFAAKIKKVEENYEKEKSISMDRKFNLEILQAKYKDMSEQLITTENLRAEIELNMTKLIEQLKDNRKELSEEQIRNRELKERFKICEGQFKTINNDLSQKLEEKINLIKSLSKQLTAYETNLNEIKYELKQTKERQVELDDIYHGSMQEIEHLTRQFTIKNDEKYFKNQQKHNNQLVTTSVVCPTLIHSLAILRQTLEEYKKHVSQTFDQLKETKTKLESFNGEYDKIRQTIESKDKLISQCDEMKNKHENEINVLRNERVALEEVINSLKNECETYKSSLNREYETNENTKKQLHKMNKTNKQIEEQKTQIFQSLYKKLLPVVSSSAKSTKSGGTNGGGGGGSDNLLNEQNLETVVENSVTQLVNYVQSFDEKLNEIELKLKTKDEYIEQITRKYEEQIQKLTKLLKDKETIFNKQKDSLVNYYEQLINDVNSRVKHSQFSANEAWEKLRDTDNATKTLESECETFKDALQKSHIQIRNLNTSCSLLVGLLVPLVKQNNELKEQRRLFEYLYKRWLQFQNQILILNENLYEKTDQINLKQNLFSEDDNDSAFEGETNLQQSSSQRSKQSAKMLMVSSTKQQSQSQKQPNAKICLFRKAVIVILAAHRLVYFYNLNINTRLYSFDSIDTRYQFIYSQSTTVNKFNKLNTTNKSLLKALLSNENEENDSESAINVESRKLFSWFTSNNHILSLLDIGHELNRYLYGEESFSNKWDLDDNLIKTTQQSILKCFTLIENIFTPSSAAPSVGSLQNIPKESISLCQRLKFGLNKLINKDLRVAKFFSFEKKIQSLNEHLFDLNQRYSSLKMERQLLKSQLDALSSENSSFKVSKAKAKTLEEELGTLKKQSLNNNNQTIPIEKFETVCKELELALNREQQAEVLLNQQSLQLQELSQKLAEFSTQELQSFKLKEILSNLKFDIQKKEKTISTLTKKINNLQAVRDSLEKSAKGTLIDKDAFIQYCQNVNLLIQKSLKPLLLNQNYHEILRIIKQIGHLSLIEPKIELQNVNNNSMKPSPETLACQHLVTSFCDNYEIILRKIIATDEEISILRKQLDVINHEYKNETNENQSTQTPSKFTSIEPESEISFRPLPNFTIHDDLNSAFKPLPVRLHKSSTPTNNSSTNS